jgi:6,7-dimethyl-8-ribityllumazine synthase
MREINGELSAKGLKIAIAASRFNSFLVEQLVKGAEDAFLRMGGAEKDLTLVRVPGAYELPFVAAKLAAKKPDAVVCLGAVVQGATAHADLIGTAITTQLLSISCETLVPVVHEVLLLDNEEQAFARCIASALNRGREAARAALEMLVAIEG